MIRYEEMTLEDLDDMAAMYVETFNSAPWNDHWTVQTARKRLHQMINVEDFYGICAYDKDRLCGIALGSKEQFYDGIMFNLKEFCVSNGLRGKGLGTLILKELEQRLIDQGVHEMVLFTSRDDGTEGFYQKRGYASYHGMVMMGKELEN